MNIFIFCWEKTIFVLTISSTLVLKHEKFDVWKFTSDDIYIIIPTISLPLSNSITAMEAFSTTAEVITRAVKMGRDIGPPIVLYVLGRAERNKIYLDLIGPGHLSPFICFDPLNRGRAGPAHLTALVITIRRGRWTGE
jgi:hypothetical protein